jgi:hypothetical protein
MYTMPILTEQQQICDPEGKSWPKSQIYVPGDFSYQWLYGQWNKNIL